MEIAATSVTDRGIAGGREDELATAVTIRDRQQVVGEVPAVESASSELLACQSTKKESDDKH